MYQLTITLDSRSNKPLYEQIYQYIKEEIREGRLSEKERLPSARTLANHLDVSRSTINLAYMQLMDEGYIYSIPAKGYFVNRIELLYVHQQNNDFPIPSVEEDRQTFLYDFSPYGIALEALPIKTFQRIRKGLYQRLDERIYARGDGQGEYELRDSICQYLFQSRGLLSHPSQIVITSGSDTSLGVLKGLLGEDKCIGIEDPSYPRVRKILSNLGYCWQYIESDDRGVLVADLEKKDVDVAYVMPSHQFPTGVVMPIRRRLELLAWAERKESRYIIEDDYDSEFRYMGKPIPPLWQNRNDGKVIYMGTFSKSIAPGIKVGYMVLPPSLLRRYQNGSGGLSCSVDRIHQLELATFMKEGYFARHLNHMRSLYKARHDILIAQLKSIDKKVLIKGENAGLHIIVSFSGIKDESLIQLCQSKGVRLYSLGEFSQSKQMEDGIIMGFGSLSIEEIKKGIEIIEGQLLQSC